MFCTLFFWISPIIDILSSTSSKNSIIELAKYIKCMMSDEVVYAMALTG